MINASQPGVTECSSSNRCRVFPDECVWFPGNHPRMKEIEARLGRIAAAASSVVINGETGTGKEILALAIWRSGPRARKKFVAQNCAGFAPHLIESQLFGQVKGAFTDAQNALGAMRAADGATLFLDEIGDLPLSLQCKLLRAIELREVTPVGSSKSYPVDFHLICATHRDLWAMVQANEFREDLYYRINVIRLCLPSLRERRDDIPLLASKLSESIAAKMGVKPLVLDEQTIARMVAYQWPGNIRELVNVLTRAYVMGDAILPAVPMAAREVRLADIDLPTYNLRELQDLAVVRSYDNLHSAEKVADDLGISVRTVFRSLRRKRQCAGRSSDPKTLRPAA